MMNTTKTSPSPPRFWQANLGLLLALVLGAPQALAADANPPERSTYQGYLVGANGDALGVTAPKNFDVIFRIFDSQTGGNKRWAEQQTVTVDNGYFSVLLGEGAAVGSEPRPALSALFAATDASDRFVEMTVKGIGLGGTDSTIAPRLRLLSSAYAFLAKQASQLVNNSGNPLVTVHDATVTVSGSVNAATVSASGNVNAAAVTASGSVNAATVTASGNVNAAAVTASGDIRAANFFLSNGSNIKHAFGDLGDPILFRDQNNGIGKFSSFGGSEIGSGVGLFGWDGGVLGIRRAGPTPNDDKPSLKWNHDSVNLFTQFGVIAGVTNNALKIHHHIDKSRATLIAREADGFGFWLEGMSSGNALSRSAVWQGDANWDFTSDRRLKTDIVDAESVLGRVMAIQMRRFRWKGGNPDVHPELGLIAQEFQPLFPELVSQGTPNKNQPDCPDGAMTVGITSLGTIAIKAIQELKREKDGEIEELKKKIASLEAKVQVANTQADQINQLVQQTARLEKLVASVGNASKGESSAEVVGIKPNIGIVAKP